MLRILEIHITPVVYEFGSASKKVEEGIQNMATDWWTFENLSAPTFRHYEWKNKEYSFGYGQDWRWVENKTGKSINELVRRANWWWHSQAWLRLDLLFFNTKKASFLRHSTLIFTNKFIWQ